MIKRSKEKIAQLDKELAEMRRDYTTEEINEAERKYNRMVDDIKRRLNIRVELILEKGMSRHLIPRIPDELRLS